MSSPKQLSPQSLIKQILLLSLLLGGLNPAFADLAPFPRVVQRIKKKPSVPAQAKALAKAVKVQVEAHDWEGFLENCDPAHKQIQMIETRIAQAQYIAEQMGVHSVGNDIATGNKVSLKQLNLIQKMSIDSYSNDKDWIEVKGKIHLKDGRRLNLLLLLKKIKDRYYLSGGVG